MAFIQYLSFDGTDIPLPESYDVEVSDVVSDAGGETEAGTTQRDVIRSGVVNIPVSFNVSPAWLKKLSEYRKEAKIKVKFFNPARKPKEAGICISERPSKTRLLVVMVSVL